MKKILILWVLLVSTLPVFAHVGSSGVLFQGNAGAYRVLVNVQPPDVIPGTAQITVFVESGTATSIMARPIYFRSGDEGAPSADAVEPVAGQLGQFQGIVWLMESGSSSIQIDIDGKNGKGQLIVPIVAVSTAEREMPPALGWTLSALGLLLVILMVTVIGAGVSDGVLQPGQELTKIQKRKRFQNMGIAFVICSVILYGGSSWWDSWASEYKQYLYKPMTATSKMIKKDGQRVVQLQVDTTNWQGSRRQNSLNFLIPDHGKLMHLFLVRIPGMDAFAHLHPERADSVTFQAYLPKLPVGKYLVYGDIVNYSGFTETITDTLEITEAEEAAQSIKKTDPEDTYVVTDPLNKPKQIPLDENVVVCGRPGTKTYLKDSSYVVWEGKANRTFEVGRPYQLNFEVYAPDGTPAELQTYLGMSGHAAIVRSDGSVYIHLHPVGTYAMAAEISLKNRIADTTRNYRRPNAKFFRDSIDKYITVFKGMPDTQREELLMKEMGMVDSKGNSTHEGMDHGSSISFPYSFPREGQYRIFLQIKRNGQVLTGIFDARVTNPLL
jgi:hypothetical protein